MLDEGKEALRELPPLRRLRLHTLAQRLELAGGVTRELLPRLVALGTTRENLDLLLRAVQLAALGIQLRAQHRQHPLVLGMELPHDLRLLGDELAGGRNLHGLRIGGIRGGTSTLRRHRAPPSP